MVGATSAIGTAKVAAATVEKFDPTGALGSSQQPRAKFSFPPLPPPFPPGSPMAVDLTFSDDDSPLPSRKSSSETLMLAKLTTMKTDTPLATIKGGNWPKKRQAKDSGKLASIVGGEVGGKSAEGGGITHSSLMDLRSQALTMEMEKLALEMEVLTLQKELLQMKVENEKKKMVGYYNEELQ